MGLQRESAAPASRRRDVRDRAMPRPATNRSDYAFYLRTLGIPIRRMLVVLEQLATRWSVAVGGQGALAIGDRLRDTKIELLDDLTLLHNRLSILISTNMMTARS